MPMFGGQRQASAFDGLPISSADRIFNNLDPSLTAPMPTKKRGLFGSIGRFLMYGGPRIQEEMEAQREARRLDRELRQAQIEAARTPKREIRSAGNDIVSVDPSTGGTEVLYQGKGSEPAIAKQIAYLRELNPRLTAEQAFKIAVNAMMPPRPMSYASGDQTITERLDPTTFEPEVVATAPRWAPKAPPKQTVKVPAGFILD